MLLLEKRDLSRRAALRAYYDEVRLSILDNIAATTPGAYRINDARYLTGAILWKAGRVDDATRSWSALTMADPSDEFGLEASQIRAAMRHSSPPAIDAQTAARILDAQRGRWLSFSATRLRRFGYPFDSY